MISSSYKLPILTINVHSLRKIKILKRSSFNEVDGGGVGYRRALKIPKQKKMGTSWWVILAGKEKYDHEIIIIIIINK